MNVVPPLIIEMAANVSKLQADMNEARRVVDTAMGAITVRSDKTVMAIEKMQAEINSLRGQLSGLQKSSDATAASLANLDSASARTNASLASIERSSKATANAMRMIPMQMTDIAVGLGSGQSPFTVLLQQGGQLKDSFGGVGEAAKGVGRYMMQLPGEIMALVNPYTAAAAAAVAMAVAINQAVKEQETLRNAIATTGNAAGVSVDQLNAMAANMASAWGVTSGQATDALAAMVQTGQVGRASLEGYAQTAMLVEKKFGTSIEKTAEHFAELGKDPVGASKRLNESMNYLSASTYEQIRAAIELGDKQKAAAIAQDAYDKALKQQAASSTENLGYVERAWRGIIDAALWAWKAMKEVWDWIKSLGRDDPSAVQIQKLQSELDLVDKGLRNVSTRQEEAMRTQLANLQETERLQRRRGDATAERTAREKQGIDEVDKKFKEQEETRKKAQQAAEAAARAQQQLVDSGVKLYGDLIAKESGLAGDFSEKWNQLSAAYASGRLNVTQLTEAQAALLALQPAMTKAREAEEKLLKRIDDEQAKAVADSWKQADAIQQQIDQQRKANETYGMGKSALAELTLAELEHQMAALQATDRVMPGYIDSLQQRIDKQRELIGVMKQGEIIDANAKAAKQAAEEWKRAWGQVSQSLTDALMRGFDAGKGFAQSLKDAVVNMFKTMVLRPVVQFIVGGVTGALGLPGAAMAGQGGLAQATQLMGIGDTISKIYSSITGGFAALGDKVAFAAQDIGAWLTTNTTGVLNQAGTSIMQASGTLGTMASYAGGALAGYGIGKAISGQYTTGLGKNAMEVGGTAIGAILGGPLGAAIGGAIGGIVNRAFGRGAMETTGEGLRGTFSATGGANVQAYTNWHQSGGWFRSDRSGTNYSAIGTDLDKFLDTAVTMTAGATREYARLLGLNTDAITGFSRSIDISLRGLDAAGKEKAIADAIGGFGNSMAEALLGEVRYVTTKVRKNFALVDKTTTEWVAGPYVREGEKASQALARLAQSVSGVNDVLKTLGQTSLGASLRMADSASQLLDLFGGLSGYTQSASQYLQAYYTDAERYNISMRNMGEALAAVGLNLPATTRQYRALVEAQNLTTDSGRKAYAALMQLAPAFAEVAGYATQVESAYKQAMLRAKPTTLSDISNSVRSQFDAIGLPKKQEGTKLRGAFVNRRTEDGSFKIQKIMREVPNMVAVSLPKTVYEFQKLVAAQDATTESGRKARLALMDLAPAFVDMVQAQEQASAAIAQQRQGLQDQLDELLGNTAALRERERNALDESNRALYDQIQALKEQQSATQAAAQAEKERADAMSAAGKTVESEIKRLLGLDGQTTSKAFLQAQFATLTGQARAGDAAALEKLPELSRAIESAGKLTATSALEMAGMRAWLASSMSETLRAVGLDVPQFAAGGLHTGGLRIVGENGPELEATGPARIYNAAQTRSLLSGGGDDMAAELRVLREEVSMLRAEARATAINTGRSADLIKRVTRNGDALVVQTDGAALEVTPA